MEEKLIDSKRNYFTVKQLAGSEKEADLKTSENIRETDTTLREDLTGSKNMLKLSQSNLFDEQKRLLNSWVFHNSYVELKNKNKNGN